MKRLISLAVALIIAAALFSFSFVAVAQEPAATLSPAGTVKKEPARPALNQPGPFKWIEVIDGGNLALIAERCGHRQTEWPNLYGINKDILPKPYLKGGVWYCLVQPKQRLRLPAGWSYGTLDPEHVVPAPAPKEVRSPEETTPPMLKKETPKVTAATSDDGRSPWVMSGWLSGLLLILALVLAILWLAGVFRRLPLIVLSRRRDPSRYPAMVPGGLSDNLDTAVRQLGVAYPGRRYERIEQCRLVRDDGVHRIHVRRMAFGDGISREAYLHPGDEVYRGTLLRGGCDYFLRSCGNLGPEFTLPAGWQVVVLTAVDIPQPTAPVPPIYPAPPISPVPPISPAPPAPPVPPAPVFPAELEPAPKSTVEPSVVTAPAEEPPATETEEIKSPRKVKVTVSGLSIEVVGNGEVPLTEVEMDDGTTVTIRQEEK